MTRTATIRKDVVAGLTADAVVRPKAMAYATVAGLSMTVGPYIEPDPGLVPVAE